MIEQKDADRLHNRDLAFYIRLDARLATHVPQHRPMARAARQRKYGGLLYAHAAPGAPPLRDQPGSEQLQREISAANRRLRDRSRSHDDPWQDSTAWAASQSRSSSWRPDRRDR